MTYDMEEQLIQVENETGIVAVEEEFGAPFCDDIEEGPEDGEGDFLKKVAFDAGGALEVRHFDGGGYV